MTRQESKAAETDKKLTDCDVIKKKFIFEINSLFKKRSPVSELGWSRFHFLFRFNY